MKEIFGVIIIALIAVLHVHLNMYTVENTLNPSFWVYLIFESPPLGGHVSQVFSDLVVLAIQCIVTSCFAILILKWNRKSIWLFSISICIIVYILFRDCVFPLAPGGDIQLFYSNIYNYDAFDLILRYSIIQIIYILSYFCVIKLKKCQKHSGISFSVHSNK